MTEFFKRCWCEIDLNRIKSNDQLIEATAKKPLIAVVKANAYGHGDLAYCKVLDQCGVSCFAVSNLEEAMRLRKAGFSQNLLILGYTPPECAQALCDNHVMQAVYDLEYADALHTKLDQIGKQLPIHIKVDTGMGRIGFVHQQQQSAVEAILSLRQSPQFILEGLFAHYAHADSSQADAKAYTKQQSDAFFNLYQTLKAEGLTFPMVHTQNSAAISWADMECNTHARAGILLYGLPPSDDVVNPISVQPVLQWKSVVSMVKQVPAGTAVSYGRTYITKQPTTLATVSVGYADGYSRALSSKGQVLIRGARCPVVGRVCMDQIMVDVTTVTGVRRGDIVTLIGTDGTETITADEMAHWLNTINYEITCSIAMRVPRVYLKDGIVQEVINYL